MIRLIYKMNSNLYNNQKSIEFINKEYNYDDGGDCFGTLSKTNVFIGENNSGKSRFLRSLFCYGFSGILNFETVYNAIKSICVMLLKIVAFRLFIML